MRLDRLIVYFETSPGIKLLRSPNAPYILDFLYQQFKDSGHITAPMSELRAALASYQESLHETHPEVLVEAPDRYLSEWCAGDSRWLHRFLDAGVNEPLCQLTPHAEDVFAFLDRVLQQDLGFIGTESRLRLIISTLADLVAGASDDPEVRLSHLREERARIEEEIAHVEREGAGARYEPAVTRERFATAVSLLRQLLGDFRAVEDRFKEITQEVQQKQLAGRDTLGNILQYALDSEDILKRDDQGVSFHEFVRFILSPAQQEKLQTIITQLGRISDLSQQQEGLATVRRMVPSLLAEAEKVMRTNQRLTATLRRLLDVRSASERKRLAILLQDIRGLAAGMAANPPSGCTAEVDVGVALYSPFSRTFWQRPHQFATVDLTEHQADDQRRMETFSRLANLRRLDWKAMRDHVHALVSARGSVTLRELVEAYPPKVGIVELLGYLQIAQDDGHLTNKDESEELVIDTAEPSPRRIRVTVPLVLFMAKEGARHG